MADVERADPELECTDCGMNKNKRVPTCGMTVCQI